MLPTSAPPLDRRQVLEAVLDVAERKAEQQHRTEFLHNRPMKVSAVCFSGHELLKDDVLEHYAQVFNEARTFGQVIEAIQRTDAHLRELGVFSAVHQSICSLEEAMEADQLDGRARIKKRAALREKARNAKRAGERDVYEKEMHRLHEPRPTVIVPIDPGPVDGDTNHDLEEFRTSFDISSSTELDVPEYVVRFKLKERVRYGLAGGAEAGDNDGGVAKGRFIRAFSFATCARLTSVQLVEGALANVFGRGEELSGKVSWSARAASEYSMRLTKPLLFTNPLKNDRGSVSVEVHQNTHSYLEECSFKEIIRGISCSFNWATALPSGDDMDERNDVEREPTLSHNISCNFDMREIAIAKDTISSVMLEGGHSVKSSLRYALSYDARDHPTSPTSGWAANFSSEVAGLLGDTSFWKNEAAMQVNIPLPLPTAAPMALSFLGRCGVILPFRGGPLRTTNPAHVEERGRSLEETSPTPSSFPSDRFYLQGPVPMRGFKSRGIGPRSRGAALGGDVFWNAGAHITSPLPDPIPSHVFGHAFVNMGNVLPWEGHAGKSRTSTVRDLFKDIRSSWGMGIVFAGAFGRLEFNASFPITAAHGDRTQRWQIGVLYSL